MRSPVFVNGRSIRLDASLAELSKWRGMSKRSGPDLEKRVFPRVGGGIELLEAAARKLSDTELEEALAASIENDEASHDNARKLGLHLVATILRIELARRHPQ
jgi:hypothetical protein